MVVAAGIVYLGLSVLHLHYNQKANRFKVMFCGASVRLIYNKALQNRDVDFAALTLMSTDVDRIAECLTKLNECYVPLRRWWLLN